MWNWKSKSCLLQVFEQLGLVVVSISEQTSFGSVKCVNDANLLIIVQHTCTSILKNSILYNAFLKLLKPTRDNK